MSRKSIGCLNFGDLFEYTGSIYRVGSLIKNTNGYVACTNIHTRRVARFYIDTTVEDIKERKDAESST